MSALGELYDDLEAHLDAATDDQAAAQATGMFRIDTLAKAAWGVRKIAKARRRFEEAEMVAYAEHSRIDDFVNSERDRLERDTAFLAGLLEGYHRTVLDEDEKAKTIATPAGKLVARKQPDVIDVTNIEAFTTWAQANAVELLRTKVEPDKAAIKRLLKPIGNGGVQGDEPCLVDPATGEVVPGLHWHEGAIQFSVDTKAST